MARYKVMENIPAGNTLWFDEARREVRAKRVSDCRTIDSRRPMICKSGLVVGDEIDPDSGAVFIGGKVKAMYAQVLYAPDPVAEETKSYEFQFDPADLHRFAVCGADEPERMLHRATEDIPAGRMVILRYPDMTASEWDGFPHNHIIGKTTRPIKKGDMVRRGPVGNIIISAREPEPEVAGASQTSNPVDVQPKYGESAMKSEALGGQPEPKLEWSVIRMGDLAQGYYFRICLVVDGELFATADVIRPAAGDLSERQSRKLEKRIEEAKAGIMRTYLLTVRQSGPANRMA